MNNCFVQEVREAAKKYFNAGTVVKDTETCYLGNDKLAFASAKPCDAGAARHFTVDRTNRNTLSSNPSQYITIVVIYELQRTSELCGDFSCRYRNNNQDCWTNKLCLLGDLSPISLVLGWGRCGQHLCRKFPLGITSWGEPKFEFITQLSINPFTPESNQCQISPPASPEILASHSCKENLAFHSLLGWKIIILQILATSLIHFLFKR